MVGSAFVDSDIASEEMNGVGFQKSYFMAGCNLSTLPAKARGPVGPCARLQCLVSATRHEVIYIANKQAARRKN